MAEAIPSPTGLEYGAEPENTEANPSLREANPSGGAAGPAVGWFWRGAAGTAQLIPWYHVPLAAPAHVHAFGAAGQPALDAGPVL